MDNSSFSGRLKQLRTDTGLTQKEFADKVGITAATLSTYEKAGKSPSIQTVESIARTFEISIDWLCGFSENKALYNTEDMGTRADVIKALIAIGQVEHIRFSGGKNGTNLLFCAPGMQTFLQGWQKMYELLRGHLIDYEVYELWKETQIQKANERYDFDEDGAFLWSERLEHEKQRER